jgi:hypothetical protein
MRDKIKKALSSKYEAQMEEAMLNIEVYMTNPAGIGEHPEIIEAIDSQIAKWTEGKEKLEALMFIND